MNEDDYDPHANLVYTLNDRQWAHFIDTMQNPRPPTPALIEGARKLRELSKSACDREYESWGFTSPDIHGGSK